MFPLKGCNKSGRISGLGGDLALGQVSLWRARLALSIKAIKSFLMVCAKWSVFSNPITVLNGTERVGGAATPVGRGRGRRRGRGRGRGRGGGTRGGNAATGGGTPSTAGGGAASGGTVPGLEPCDGPWVKQNPTGFVFNYHQTPGPTSPSVTPACTALDLFRRFFTQNVWLKRPTGMLQR